MNTDGERRMNQQAAEWIESAFGVVFVNRADLADGTQLSTLEEREVVRIVNELTTRLAAALELLGKLTDRKAAQFIGESMRLLPTALLSSAHKVNATLQARLDYDAASEADKARVAGKWLDLEDTLTGTEYAVYISRWQQLRIMRDHSGAVDAKTVFEQLMGAAQTEREVSPPPIGEHTPAGRKLLEYIEGQRRAGETTRDAERRLMADHQGEDAKPDLMDRLKDSLEPDKPHGRTYVETPGVINLDTPMSAEEAAIYNIDATGAPRFTRNRQSN